MKLELNYDPTRISQTYTCPQCGNRETGDRTGAICGNCGTIIHGPDA